MDDYLKGLMAVCVFIILRKTAPNILPSGRDYRETAAWNHIWETDYSTLGLNWRCYTTEQSHQCVISVVIATFIHTMAEI